MRASTAGSPAAGAPWSAPTGWWAPAQPSRARPPRTAGSLPAWDSTPIQECRYRLVGASTTVPRPPAASSGITAGMRSNFRRRCRDHAGGPENNGSALARREQRGHCRHGRAYTLEIWGQLQCLAANMQERQSNMHVTHEVVPWTCLLSSKRADDADGMLCVPTPAQVAGSDCRGPRTYGAGQDGDRQEEDDAERAGAVEDQRVQARGVHQLRVRHAEHRHQPRPGATAKHVVWSLSRLDAAAAVQAASTSSAPPLVESSLLGATMHACCDKTAHPLTQR